MNFRNFTILCVLLCLTVSGCRNKKTRVGEIPLIVPPTSSNGQQVTTDTNDPVNETSSHSNIITAALLEKNDVASIDIDPELFIQAYGTRCLSDNPDIVQLPNDNQASLNQFLRDSILRYEWSADCVQYALKKGANPDFKVEDGKTALQYIIERWSGDRIHDMIENRDYNIIYEWALDRIYSVDDPEKIEALIDNGASINVTDEYGRTLLMFLSSISITFIPTRDDALLLLRPPYVNTLIEAGAKVNAVTQSGMTSLMYASYVCSVYSVKSLIAAGANVNAINADGDTALRIASRVAERRFSLRGDNIGDGSIKDCLDTVGILSLHSNQ